MLTTDVLVIGSGISGLSYAIKVAQNLPQAQITIVTKADGEESNTKYAQGGVAVVTDFQKDSFEKHIEDTLRAGDGHCNRDAVEVVVTEGPQTFKEIDSRVAHLDQDKLGTHAI